jgi:hypothetical protein
VPNTIANQRKIRLVGFVGSVEAALTELDGCDMMMVSATLPEGGALHLVKAATRLQPWVRILVTNLAGAQGTAIPYLDAGAAGWVL